MRRRSIDTARIQDHMVSGSPDALTTTELVEVVLGRAVPGAVEPANLARSGYAELVAHYGDRSAIVLSAALELGRRCVGETPVRGQRLGCAAEVWQHFRARLAWKPVEEFWTIALDVRHRVISEVLTARGSLTGVEVNPRDIFRPLVAQGAAGAIFVHNHPSGEAGPSVMDIEITNRLRQAGELMGIKVLDHVVVAADGYVSISDRGWT